MVDARAVQVHDVERGSGSERVGEHLLHRRDRHIAHVGVDGDIQFRREFKDAEDLSVSGAGVVLVGHPDAQPPGPDLGGDRRVHRLGVLDPGVVRLPEEVGALKVPFGPGALGNEDFAGPFRDPGNPEKAQSLVARRRTVVDDRRAGAALQIAPDPGNAVLEFQRGGHAVHRLVTVRFGRLSVGMEVNEPGAYHLPRGVEQHPALLQPVLEHLAGDRDDLVSHHPHVADRIQPRLGIEDAAPGDDQIQVALLGRRGFATGCQEGRGKQERDAEGAEAPRDPREHR